MIEKALEDLAVYLSVSCRGGVGRAVGVGNYTVWVVSPGTRTVTERGPYSIKRAVFAPVCATHHVCVAGTGLKWRYTGSVVCKGDPCA